MLALSAWLVGQGPRLAEAIETQRDPICERVSRSLAVAYPTLCYHPARLDAASFQQTTFEKSPRRLHAVITSALRFHTLVLIDREYEWTWKIMPRYGVNAEHMAAMVRMYFEALREEPAIVGEDGPYFEQLENYTLRVIEQLEISQPVVAPSVPAASRMGHRAHTARRRPGPARN